MSDALIYAGIAMAGGAAVGGAVLGMAMLVKELIGERRFREAFLALWLTVAAVLIIVGMALRH